MALRFSLRAGLPRCAQGMTGRGENRRSNIVSRRTARSLPRRDDGGQQEERRTEGCRVGEGADQGRGRDVPEQVDAENRESHGRRALGGRDDVDDRGVDRARRREEKQLRHDDGGEIDRLGRRDEGDERGRRGGEGRPARRAAGRRSRTASGRSRPPSRRRRSRRTRSRRRSRRTAPWRRSSTCRGPVRETPAPRTPALPARTCRRRIPARSAGTPDSATAAGRSARTPSPSGRGAG